MFMSDDPFVGRWRLNPARCDFDPNHQAREATMIFERTPDGAYLMRASGKDQNGTFCEEKPQRVIADGVTYALPEYRGLSSVSKQPSRNRLETVVSREDGSIAGQSTMEVSADGRSLAATNSGWDAQLREFRQVTVWERE
jgi:hypothetical protein